MNLNKPTIEDARPELLAEYILLLLQLKQFYNMDNKK